MRIFATAELADCNGLRTEDPDRRRRLFEKEFGTSLSGSRGMTKTFIIAIKKTEFRSEMLNDIGEKRNGLVVEQQRLSEALLS
jgi:hypothetical protein